MRQQYEIFNEMNGMYCRQDIENPFKQTSIRISKRFGYSAETHDAKPKRDDITYSNSVVFEAHADTPVYAGFSGTVSDVSGQKIIIVSNNKKLVYDKCASVSVRIGQAVNKGDYIAKVGRSNNIALEYFVNNISLVPNLYLNSENTFIKGAISTESSNRILEEAQKYLGMRYVWGGKTPETGFDCSGFVSWCFTASGVKNVQASAQGLYEMSDKIMEDELSPGDLVFFTGTDDRDIKISHVEIYVGNGMCIGAGDPINYHSLSNSWYRQHLYSYGRLITQ